MKIIIDGNKISDRHDLFALLEDALDHPVPFGHNLDALQDVLSDYDYQAEVIIRNADQLKERLGSGFTAGLKHIFQDTGSSVTVEKGEDRSMKLDQMDKNSRRKYLADLSLEEKYDALNEIIRGAKHVTFFGGAGVSTESGIPDFRSKDGLYNQHDVQFDAYSPEYLLSHDCLVREPEVFFEFYRQKMDVRGIEPNKAHKKLAELEKAGKLNGVITQNIDGLHQLAGSKNVQEVHGTTLRNYCMKCHREVPADFIFTSEDKIPVCPHCGGMIRPDVTLYGEGLPDAAWSNAMDLISEADVFIVGGTSLSVYPAANLVRFFHGDYLIIVNMQHTNYDQYADLVFHEKIGEVFSHISI